MRKHTTPPQPLRKRAELAPAAFRLRCEELARLRGAIAAPGQESDLSAAFFMPNESSYTPDGELAACVLKIRSASDDKLWHSIACDIFKDTQRCTCPAGMNSQPCWHAGLARQAAIAAAAIVSAELERRILEAAKRADAEMEAARKELKELAEEVARRASVHEEWRETMYSREKGR